MTGLLPCTSSDTCQTDTACHRPPRFQAHLDAPQHAQRPRVRRRTEACASHLGAMVQAMTIWAREQELADGDLTILTINPSSGASRPGQPHSDTQTSGLVFSTIHLGH
jgi:hypothetical protein